LGCGAEVPQCGTLLLPLHNNKKERKKERKKEIGKCGPCPVFASYTLAFALQLRKKHGKTSVKVVEKCPDIPVAVVQYTFTHKQYTEQHNKVLVGKPERKWSVGRPNRRENNTKWILKTIWEECEIH
jgi:hypothetical protein